MSSIYDRDLDKTDANHQPLTPLHFLARSAGAFPEHPAIIHEGPRARQDWSYAQFYADARRLGSALGKRGIGRGDTVAAMLLNTPPMLLAHFGVPMAGAVINCLNLRLDARIIAFSLDHGEAKAIIIERELVGVLREWAVARK